MLSKFVFDHLSTDEKIDTFVQEYRVPQNKSKAEAFRLIQAKIEQNQLEKPVRNLRVYWSAAASVILIALLTTIYFYPSKPEQIFSGKGKQLNYTLPDGSTVNINADTKISFSESDFTKKRILKLDGEAFFSVQKGNPFDVVTRLGKIGVLGTTFNVYSRNQELIVTCLTGKVQVSVKDQNMLIEAGEQTVLKSGTLQKSAIVSVEKVAGWRNGEFHFESMPLISIFEEIERQFNVSITTTGLENRYFTGDFTNKNLIEALETVCLPMKLDYEITNGNQIGIKPKKE
jgi:ferric-dicitrate binding protein FerR (iron transport regulator)